MVSYRPCRCRFGTAPSTTPRSPGTSPGWRKNRSPEWRWVCTRDGAATSRRRTAGGCSLRGAAGSPSGCSWPVPGTRRAPPRRGRAGRTRSSSSPDGKTRSPTTSAWPMSTVAELLALPGVLGIKVATLDSVMTFQEIAAAVAGVPGKLLVTGEDRFLGYSLLLGAEAALVGMGAALTDVQAELLRARRDADWSRFVRLSAVCDDFSRATFRAPMEGYVRRML